MAYTSSALSFLLEDLGKTVVRFHQSHLTGTSDQGSAQIVTGAQIPLSQLRNDAVDNLLGALSIAGHYIIPGNVKNVISRRRFLMMGRVFSSECCLFFNHTLFRGNRVSKSSSHDLNAFTSPNLPPLVNGEFDVFQRRRQ
jgi:lysophospholipase